MIALVRVAIIEKVGPYNPVLQTIHASKNKLKCNTKRRKVGKPIKINQPFKIPLSIIDLIIFYKGYLLHSRHYSFELENQDPIGDA